MTSPKKARTNHLQKNRLPSPETERALNRAHLPVLLSEILKYSELSEISRIFDGTLGLAGHLTALLTKYRQAVGFACDRDAEMLMKAESILKEHHLSDRAELAHAAFAENPFSAKGPFDLILLDLGISSLHLDEFERGISFRRDEPLDMRLDTSNGVPVAEWLNSATEEEISNVIFKYGEEKAARRIAREIVERRQGHRLETTADLTAICDKAVRGGKRYTERKKSVKTFQALRIFINDELGQLERALAVYPGMLSPGGLFMVIAFHSLEDRMVKQAFRNLERIPVVDPAAKSSYIEGAYRLPQRKAVTASESELQRNPRARSARLRILQLKPV